MDDNAATLVSTMFRLSILVALASFTWAANLPSVARQEGKIVNGVQANIKELNYQVSVQIKFYGRFFHVCGGALISGNVVVSAAHCFYPIHPSDIYAVRAGSSNSQQGGQLVYASSIIMNPFYDPDTNDYDVAVLKLEQNIKFGYSVLPILLDDGLTVTDVANTVGVVSGWGATAFNGDASTTSLLKTTVPLVTREQCQSVYASIGNITERMICAGNGESDSCQGDSGGPLAVNRILVGIVSWGNGCARPGFPGIYTKVSDVVDWIEAQI